MPINPDKIRVVEKPNFRPMQDVFDKDTEGPVVDLGIDLDRFFGSIFIKVKHFEFIAREFLGMVTKAEHDLILGLERDANDKYLKAQSALEKLQEERQEIFNDKLTEFLANYSGGDGPADSDSNLDKITIANALASGASKRKAKEIETDTGLDNL